MAASSEEPGTSHPWREKRVFHSVDLELRSRGYEIVSRPKKGPALWQRRGGPVVTQEEALKDIG